MKSILIIKSIYQTIKISIKIFIRTKSFQEIINLQFSDKNKTVVELGVIDYVVTKNKDKFYMSKLIDTITQVQHSYKFDDMYIDDIVIDIGASIGGFSIPASRKAKKVYAIEPMTTDMLRKNIFLNKIENIEVLDMALGDGKLKTLEWLSRKRTIKTSSLSEIITLCGGCDFLKIDCEGCEWDINLEELKGIRRIEMEVHKVGFPISLMEKRLNQAGFSCERINQPEGNIGLWIIHAKKIKQNNERK